MSIKKSMISNDLVISVECDIEWLSDIELNMIFFNTF